jgi:hypothetical protein
MSRARTLALLTVLVAATVGCGAAREAQMAAANAPTADVNGTWSGSAGTGGQFAPVTMNLTQSGTAVSKVACRVSSSTCRSSGSRSAK